MVPTKQTGIGKPETKKIDKKSDRISLNIGWKFIAAAVMVTLIGR